MKIEIPTYKQISEYVIEHFLMLYEVEGDMQILVEKCHNKFAGDFIAELNNIEHLKPVFYEWKSYKFPVFFENNAGNKEGFSDRKICFDVFLNTFLLLSGIQEWLIKSRDKHGRFSYYDSIQYKFSFIEVPVVNIYFKLLADVIKSQGINILEKNKNRQAIIMTHDIDQLNMGYIADFFFNLKHKGIQGFLKLPVIALKKIFLKKDIFRENIDRIIEEEKRAGLKSIFFMLVNKGKNEADYDLTIARNKKIVSEQLSTGGEVQLHPGFLTYNNNTEFNYQIEKFEDLTNQKVNKIRQHYLKYDVRCTNKLHEDAGVETDFSLGFAEHYGFRNSICSPFYLYRFDVQNRSKVLEVPTFFMDGTIVDYIKENRKENAIKILRIMRTISQDFNALFSVLFHNIFRTDKYSGLWEMYLKVLELMKMLGKA